MLIKHTQGYFDYQATTPTDPRVVEAMAPYFTEHFGNPSSSAHAWGWKAEAAVQVARAQVAKLIHASPREIIFTSGASESNNFALKGFTHLKKIPIAISTVEHKSTLETAKFISKSYGNELTQISCNQEGFLDLAQLEKTVSAKSGGICSIIAAQNEIGTIQSLAEISKICHKHGWILHVDAAQAMGKLAIDVDVLGIDLLSLSGHKMYGPKGVGALYVRRRDPRVELVPLIHGGGQEYGLRSGTLAVSPIVGLGKASELAQSEMEAESQRHRELRGDLWKKIQGIFPNAILRGPSLEDAARLPHNLNVTFPKVDAQALILELKGFGLSTASACGSDSVGPSHVLKAIGCSDEDAHATLRFAVGRFTRNEDVTALAESLARAAKKLI